MIYVGTMNGIFRSDDGGASWIESNNGLTVNYVATIAIDPQNPTRLYAGTDGRGVFKGQFINFEHDLFCP